MQVGKYIHAKLLAAAPVTAIVGTGANARITPIFLPQGTTGVGIVYSVENRPHGTGKEHSGTHDHATVTLHLWADVSQGQKAYATLETLDAAVRDALDYQEATAGGVTVESCRYLGSNDDRDEQNLYFLKTVTYSVVHRR
jgi:hypothetical protein